MTPTESLLVQLIPDVHAELVAAGGQPAYVPAGAVRFSSLIDAVVDRLDGMVSRSTVGRVQAQYVHMPVTA